MNLTISNGKGDAEDTTSCKTVYNGSTKRLIQNKAKVIQNTEIHYMESDMK